MSPTPSIPARMLTTLNPDDGFERQMERVILTHRERNAQYVTSPLEILPVENWLTQVAIKGVRAQQAIVTMKVIDELVDVIVYSGMCLEQIAKQEWVR